MRIEDLTAVIVVGGRGTRLGLPDLPKPMVPIAGVPLLERAVQQLAAQGVRRVILLAGHLGEVICDHFGDSARRDIEVEVVIEPDPLGPAGCLHLVRDRLPNPFLVIYGDVLWNVDLERFVAFASDRGGLGTIYAHPNDHPFDSDLIETGARGQVLAFHSKPHAPGVERRNLVNAGFYLLAPEILDHVPPPPENSDWGRDVLPAVIRNGGALYAYRGTEYLRDMGTPHRLRSCTADFLSGSVVARNYRAPQRAIFLDRDGVLNREIGGVHAPDDLVLLPGVADAVRRINRSGYLAICVTNQPDRAKGRITAEELEAVHARLDAELARGHAYLDDLLVCPHHPDVGWPGEDRALKIACACRKPQPGMLLSAISAHNIDPAGSWIIGDHIRDIDAGARAGVRPVFVGEDTESLGRLGEFPDMLRAADLSAAIETILAERPAVEAVG